MSNSTILNLKTWGEKSNGMAYSETEVSFWKGTENQPLRAPTSNAKKGQVSQEIIKKT